MVRTKISSLFGKITVFCIICCFCLPALAKYGGGTGEPNDPYLIYTAEQMNEIGLSVNWDDRDKHFKLMADINLSRFAGTTFNIIGNTTTPFVGVFDGNGHTISNFTCTYTSTGRNYVGLFGYVDSPTAEIKHLTLIDVKVDAFWRDYVGSLVGQLSQGTITNCYLEGGSISGHWYVGGLVGSNGGMISNSYSYIGIWGDWSVGGLVGLNDDGTISNCYSAGMVQGKTGIGGLVGYHVKTITNCYSTANVSGDHVVGGLVGRSGGTITNSYSVGVVSGKTDMVGGLVGMYDSGSIFGSFWDIHTSGHTSSYGGTGKTTAEMQDANTFIDAGWGCGSDWTIDEGKDYPRLGWENMPGGPLTLPSYEGSGTEVDPYLIYTAEELNTIGLMTCDWDKHFKLMADVDLGQFTGEEFKIIGYYVSSFDYKPFTGVFDGNGHTISNFSHIATDKSFIGLFGYVSGENAEIKNLGLIALNVDAGTGHSVGSLVGCLEEGTITECYVQGGNVSGNDDIGSLVGSNGGTISNCYSTGSVSGHHSLGGLCGFNNLGTIDNSYATGSVTGDENSSRLGGLVGYNRNGSSVSSCYSTGSVSGHHDVGGLVGRNNGAVSASFWDIETSEQTSSAGGWGKTTAQMQKASTFGAWACVDNFAWTIDEGNDYPRLVWENKPGELITIPSGLYGGGSGEPDDPYLIYTAEQLNTIGLFPCHLDKHFKLMSDIDLSSFTGTSFNIIGNHENHFTGLFDGDGYTISQFVYKSNYRDYIGLFGYVRGGIKDLGLINPNVDAGTGHFVGSLVGWLREGTITECYVEGGSVAGNDYVGGLVGSNYGTIINCYSTGSVSGYHSLGGLCGFNNNFGTINNSYSTGSVTGDENSSRLGGLVGDNRNGSSVSSCYSTGSVSGHHDVGGLVGMNNSAVSASFWDIETSGQTTSAGGWGKTTTQMQKASTFGAWACVDNFAWTIDEGNDYPRLVWENAPGEAITTPSYGGGSGKPDDPYLIYTAEQLNTIGLISCHLDKHFKLMADIDLNGYTGTSFNIIGTGANAFKGVFDGNVHTISNFVYTSTGRNDIGLFGYVNDPDAEIKNLGLIAPNVDAGTGRYVGSLVGYLTDGTISNCYVEGGSVAGHQYVGGLVGSNGGVVSNSYSYIGVMGNYYVGGLVGSNGGTISNCYSTGSVSGYTNVGGLVGYNYKDTITNCYSTGGVTGNNNVGGLVGSHYKGVIKDSFWDIETSGQTTSAGGWGKTTAQMQKASTFSIWVCGNNTIWTIDEGKDYPRLWWEDAPGELINLPSYDGGSGEPNDPYLIYTAEQLNTIGLVPCHLDKHFKLISDIDLSSFTGTSFNIIGTRANAFNGIFDGNGHIISNFTYTSPGRNDVGLFGYVLGSDAEIKDLGLINPNIDAGTGENFGSLVGYLTEGTISNCYVEGSSVLGNDAVGGLVGRNGGTITNCYAHGDVEGRINVGGMVGYNYTGTITNCYSSASVSGIGSYVGGLVGRNNGTVSASFWDIETSGQTTSAGGMGRTTGQMKMAATFTCYWSNEPVWTIDEGFDYPRLWWENKPGELIIPPSDLYGGGSGEPEDPYLIYTAEQLNTIGLIECIWDKHFKLMADIDLSNITGTFNIIGYYRTWSDKKPFTGVFDGNGYTILNFTYDSNDTGYIGMIGYVRYGEILNLGLIAPNVDAGTGSYVGSLVGYLYYGNISGCYVEVGGVSGEDYVGGLVGRNDGTINDCYSNSSVSGTTRVGGLVGSNSGYITNSYSTSSVSGVDDIGGLVGAGSGYVSGSYWDAESSGQSSSAGGTGKTTAEMKMASTFVHWGACGEVWIIDESVDYPRLWWENKLGEIITAPSVLYGGGIGEPNDPYLIYTAEHLSSVCLITCDWDKHFKLMADIDLAGYTKEGLNVIGTSANHFTGVFNGNGHTVANFTCNYYSGRYRGLFGYVNGGEIVNLGLIEPNVAVWGYTAGSLVGYMSYGKITNCYAERVYIYGGSPIGGLVGYNNGTITSCHATGSVTGGPYVGGLVGYNDGTITNCCSTSSVTGDDCVGGLVGCNLWGLITNCYSTGIIEGDNYLGGLVGESGGYVSDCYSTGDVIGEEEVGGLVGANRYWYWSGTIYNCYSTGSVLGNSEVGGLVGSNEVYSTITRSYATGNVWGDISVGGLVGDNYLGSIINCYSAGSVSGGGLVGENWWGIINNSYWDIESSGQDWSDGGTGLPTDQMQTMSTFTDAGWDFMGETVNGIKDIWFIPQQDYPHLWWEGMRVPMKMTPRTLNCRSEGNWVKAHITLPQGFTVADVNSDRPAVLHSFGFQSAPLYVFVNKDKLVEIEAAFEREQVCSLAGNWPDTLTVAGFLADGNIFLGTSNVRINHPGMKVIEELALYWLNADCVHPDFCDGIDMNRDSIVNLLDYALLMNINVEFVTDE